MKAVPRVFVVMEAAATHGGSLDAALRLVDLAREAGADAVKFQWLSDPKRLVERRRAPEHLEQYRRLAFPREWFPTLVSRCSAPRDNSPLSTDPPDARHAVPAVEFMCTAYLPEDVHVVAPYVARFKVSSFEARDAHFVALHAEYRKPLIVSVGLKGYETIASVLERYRNVYPDDNNQKIDVLHCVSAYPCPGDQARLRRLRYEPWSARPHWCTGYSDHTRHPWAGALAVAAGARVVEFHARLDDCDPQDADYAVARSPQEAAEYVRNIRAAEAMLGPDDPYGPIPAEEPMMRYRVA